MDAAEAQELARVIGSVDLAVADRTAVEAAAVAVRRLLGWCHAHEAAVALRLAQVNDCPQAILANAGRVGLKDADRVIERARTIAAMPNVEHALSDGAVTSQHVDILTKALRRLDNPEAQASLIGQSSRLATIARHANTLDFQRTVDDTVAAINRTHGDTGEQRWARQRAAARIRTYVNSSDGMWNIRGCLDPATGLLIDGRLRAISDTMFASGPPEHVPTDPGERADHLRALAFIELIQHGADAGLSGVVEPNHSDGRAGRASDVRSGGRSTESTSGRATAPPRRARWRSDTLLVLHTASTNSATARQLVTAGPRHPVGSPESQVALAEAIACGTLRADSSGVAELPAAAVADRVLGSHVDTVELDQYCAVIAVNGSNQRLNLGRQQHVAGRAQRLALRAMYPTCAVPGCAVRYEFCAIHHIVWWRHGGLTDLDNLVPLCTRHHHHVHDDGWRIELAGDREITITLPHGEQLNGHPPPPPDG
jgi:hypothetical protein